MLREKIGIIGAGKIGSAILRGVIRGGLVEKNRLIASAPREAVRNVHAQETGVTVTSNNAEVVDFSDMVILTVKPQVIHKVLEEIAPRMSNQKLLVSVAAGVSLARIEGSLPDNSRVVRVMTNMPCLIGTAASAYAGGTHATSQDLNLVEKILQNVGIALQVQERDLDAVTALGGSGPAYVFLFMEALADAGVHAGLSRDVALRLAVQTVYGSAKLAAESGKHLAQLKDEVTSPGGTTIAGLYALEKGGFSGLVMEAILRATDRSRELGKAQA